MCGGEGACSFIGQLSLIMDNKVVLMDKYVCICKYVNIFDVMYTGEKVFVFSLHIVHFNSYRQC